MHNALHIHTTMKENNGRARREQLTRKLCLVFFAFFCVIGALFALEHGMDDPDAIYNNVGGRQRKNLWQKMRKRQTRDREHMAVSDRSPNDDKKLSWEFNRVLAADFNLIDLQVTSESALRNAPANSYDGVHGVFCQLDFAKHKEDPSSGTLFGNTRILTRCWSYHYIL